MFGSQKTLQARLYTGRGGLEDERYHAGFVTGQAGSRAPLEIRKGTSRLAEV